MRVEERVNRTTTRQRGHSLHQRVGARGRSAIDEQHAATSRLRDDVGFARERDDEEIVTQLLCDRSSGRGLSGRRGKTSTGLAPPKQRSGEGGRTQNESGRAAEGGFQYLSTCVSVPGHHGFR